MLLTDPNGYQYKFNFDFQNLHYSRTGVFIELFIFDGFVVVNFHDNSLTGNSILNVLQLSKNEI